MRFHTSDLQEARENISDLLWWDFFTPTVMQEVEEKECYGQVFVLFKTATILFAVLCTRVTPA